MQRKFSFFLFCAMVLCCGFEYSNIFCGRAQSTSRPLYRSGAIQGATTHVQSHSLGHHHRLHSAAFCRWRLLVSKLPGLRRRQLSSLHTWRALQGAQSVYHLSNAPGDIFHEPKLRKAACSGLTNLKSFYLLIDIGQTV